MRPSGWVVAAAAAALGVWACSGGDDRQSDASRRLDKRRAQSAVADAQVKAAPAARTYDVNGHQLVVVDVLSKDSYNLIESQKCFIWRDSEFKTASIACPAQLPDASEPSSGTYTGESGP